MAAETTTFVWLSGHVRNVGDSVLRRAYAAALRDASSLRAWSSAPGSDYERGLDLEAHEASPSFGAWYWSLVRAAIVSRPALAFNAGAFSVTKAYFAGMVALLPVLALLRAKGAPIVWAGAAIGRRKPGFTWPFTLLARWSSPLVWRDTRSATVMGRGATMPDWAFGLASGGAWHGEGEAVPPLSERPYLAISLRGDRQQPSDAWIASVRSLAERLDLRIACVAQVSDDDALAKALAARLDGEHVAWTHSRHDLQEQLVREWYARSALLLSDRLHGLIMAATEGCVPLGWTETSSDKVRIHLDVVGAGWASPVDGAAAAIDALDAPALATLWQQSQRMASTARRDVHAVAADIAARIRDAAPADAA